MQNRINIGVLGCAGIAQKSVIPAILELPEQFRLAGIASRDGQTAINCADKFSTKPFTGYSSLLDEPTLEAIYIPLPNSLHAEWIDLALDKGLHVLVEKPLGCSLQEVNYLNNKAKSKKLIIVENFQFRFHEQMNEITKILEKGWLGKLRCVRASFGFPPFQDKDNIRYQKKLGGGAILDAGAYTIKISQIFLGYDISVKAAKVFFDEEKEIDLWGGGYLEQKNGDLFSQISFGFDNFYQCSLELWGSMGKLSSDRIFTCPPGVETNLIFETAKQRQVIKIQPDNHFKKMLLHFNRMVETPSLAEDEYIQNVNQSRLLEEFKNISNGK